MYIVFEIKIRLLLLLLLLLFENIPFIRRAIRKPQSDTDTKIVKKEEKKKDKKQRRESRKHEYRKMDANK